MNVICLQLAQRLSDRVILPRTKRPKIRPSHTQTSIGRFAWQNEHSMDATPKKHLIYIYKKSQNLLKHVCTLSGNLQNERFRLLKCYHLVYTFSAKSFKHFLAS